MKILAIQSVCLKIHLSLFLFIVLICDALFCPGFASEQEGISVDVIRKAFSATEEGFISIVRKQWLNKPQIASVGSCCLVGIISGGMLYVANVGDSRVVLGRIERGIREVTAVQMSAEHNASFESVREELHSLHPNDPQIVVLKHKVWRVKGLIQVTSFMTIPQKPSHNIIIIHMHFCLIRECFSCLLYFIYCTMG